MIVTPRSVAADAPLAESAAANQANSFDAARAAEDQFRPNDPRANKPQRQNQQPRRDKRKDEIATKRGASRHRSWPAYRERRLPAGEIMEKKSVHAGWKPALPVNSLMPAKT